MKTPTVTTTNHDGFQGMEMGINMLVYTSVKHGLEEDLRRVKLTDAALSTMGATFSLLRIT